MHKPRKPLTARELACLHWTSIGKTSWETGVILGITERTVNFHIQNACRKLGVHGRQAAITIALNAGLVSGISEPYVSLAETLQPEPEDKPAPAPLRRPRPDPDR